MVQHTRHAIQLRRRPLPVLEPDIWKPPDVRHDRQAEVDDEPPDGARDHLALEVGQSSEQAVQVAATVVVEDAYQADARARSHIAQQAPNRDTVIGHDIIARVAGVAAPGPHIIGQRIAISTSSAPLESNGMPWSNSLTCQPSSAFPGKDTSNVGAGRGGNAGPPSP